MTGDAANTATERLDRVVAALIEPGHRAGDGPEWRLYDTARQRTPLPGSGVPLGDYPPGVGIAEGIRAAGRDPLTRLTTGNAAIEARE